MGPYRSMLNAAGITLKRPSIPSTVFGIDEPLCHGAGGLHARIWLGEESVRPSVYD